MLESDHASVADGGALSPPGRVGGVSFLSRGACLLSFLPSFLRRPGEETLEETPPRGGEEVDDFCEMHPRLTSKIKIRVSEPRF